MGEFGAGVCASSVSPLGPRVEPPRSLRPLGVPVCTILPSTYELFGDEFRKAEGFYGVFAALGGAHLLRVHEVPHLRAVLQALEALSVG